MVLIIFFAVLTFASWVYWLIAYWQVRAFFREHRNGKPVNFHPPVSILKPVKGADPDAYENFASFCRQDYPKYEILFGVADSNDPIVPTIRKLQADFPGQSIQLYVVHAAGANQKACLLDDLARRATYDVLAISDSDMRVTPGYLEQVVAPLADPTVGLVTCPYRGADPVTLTARLEALHIGVSFLPSMIVARRLFGFSFGMGSTEVVRKGDLERIGGFAPITDYLADDYQLGVQISQLGLKVAVSGFIVDTMLGKTSFGDQWKREVRWAHCNRVSRPKEYPGLLLTYSTPLAFALLLAAWFNPLAWAAFGITLLLRWTISILITDLTHDAVSRRWLVWLPMREMLSALIWIAGLVGRKVTWRGTAYLLMEDGRMQAIPPKESWIWRYPLVGLQWLVMLIDAILVRVYGIYSFDKDERCILRVAVGKSSEDLTLSDGTEIRAGEPIGEIHFWNERLPQIPPEGVTVRWALLLQRKLRYSLGSLASYIEATPELENLPAFHGAPPINVSDRSMMLENFFQHWGFDYLQSEPLPGAWGRFVYFWENVYAAGLIIAYNPGSLKSRQVGQIRHTEVWVSRQVLLERYGSAGKSAKERLEEKQYQAVDYKEG